MKFSILAIAASLSLTVSANPLIVRQAPPLCSGLTNTPLCCATDVLGVADLDCATPPQIPQNVSQFTTICATIGQRARCCALPILEQGLICGTPV